MTTIDIDLRRVRPAADAALMEQAGTSLELVEQATGAEPTVLRASVDEVVVGTVDGTVLATFPTYLIHRASLLKLTLDFLHDWTVAPAEDERKELCKRVIDAVLAGHVDDDPGGDCVVIHLGEDLVMAVHRSWLIDEWPTEETANPIVTRVEYREE